VGPTKVNPETDAAVLRIRIRDPMLFDPWIRDPDQGWKKSGSGMNIPDHFPRA
jgi:hypothetical protein